MIELKVNGMVHSLSIDPNTPLLWVLREQLNLTGTKYSCGIAECGSCTVLINEEATLSCQLTIQEAEGEEITTIEGLKGPISDALQSSWEEEDVPQCGYCQPGQMMTAASLLKSNPAPDDAAIDDAMSGVLCRCGTYKGIRKAIHLASERLSK